MPMTDAQRAGLGIISMSVVIASGCAWNPWTGAVGLIGVVFAIWSR